ncbi:MAG: helix-turn-helix transcriptional regulator [Verrucomicrobia bacterium]|nr:helix-turn-helix transcriptional regulator [Verrucomicrobiota bacterium]
MPKSAAPHALSDRALELIAERFRALSQPLRLRLIILLEGGERTVTELVQASGQAQTNVSRQLQSLTRAGVLSRRRQGVSVYYRIADPAIFDLCRHVCGSLQEQFRQQGEASKLFRL